MAGMVSKIRASSVRRSSPILVHVAKITSTTAIATPTEPRRRAHPGSSTSRRRGTRRPSNLLRGPRHRGWPWQLCRFHERDVELPEREERAEQHGVPDHRG